MEEERPSEMADSSEETQSNRPSGMLIAGIGVVALLIIAGLVMLGQQFGLGGGDATTADSSPTSAPTETETIAVSNPSIPGEVDVTVNDADATIMVSSLSEADAAADIGAFPANATVRGSVFKIESDVSAPRGKIAINVPSGTAVEMVDLYGWNGSSWQFVPSQIDVETRQIVSAEHNLYEAFALAEPGDAETVAVAAELLMLQALSE